MNSRSPSDQEADDMIETATTEGIGDPRLSRSGAAGEARPYDAPASHLVAGGQKPEPRHCGFGIASFTISMLSIVLVFVAFGVAGYMEVTTPGGINEDSPQAVILGLAIFALILAMFVALVLGVVSVFRKDRKRMFGIMGSLFSGFALMLVVGVIALGMAVGQ